MCNKSCSVGHKINPSIDCIIVQVCFFYLGYGSEYVRITQARMGVSATAGLPHPVRPAHLPPSVRPNGELGQCSIQVGTGRLGNGLSTNQSPGIVRGQPAVPMTGIVS